jgi:GMP synthase-like glutamine amidotransferase
MKKLLIFQHVDREEPSYIRQYADDHGIGVDVIPLWKPYTLPRLADYDGFVILGGPMGAYEMFPSRDDELRVIKEAAESGIPALGVCLGAQLIAAALGARVYPHEREGKRVKEIGHYTVELTEEGRAHGLFKGFPPEMTVLQWHGDTFDIPEGALHLARSALCDAQAFAKGNLHGLQFHVENSPERLKPIVDADHEWSHSDFDLDEEAFFREAEALAPQMKAQCYRLMENFLGA